eukprot:gene6992-biopygen713
MARLPGAAPSTPLPARPPPSAAHPPLSEAPVRGAGGDDGIGGQCRFHAGASWPDSRLLASASRPESSYPMGGPGWKARFLIPSRRQPAWILLPAAPSPRAATFPQPSAAAWVDGGRKGGWRVRRRFAMRAAAASRGTFGGAAIVLAGYAAAAAPPSAAHGTVQAVS